MNFSVELFLLIVSALFFVSILASKAGSKLGVPVLLLFLGVGMLFGSDGLGIKFSNFQMAQAVSTIALCIILFSGGLDTKLESIKPVIVPGVLLATVGVLLTAILTGFIIWFILGKTAIGAGIGLLTCILLASTMSSTDSASVFSILRSKGLNLKYNLKPLLELESGSNDPMAYIMTITLISLVKQGGSPDYLMAILTVLIQLAVGAALGYLIGKGLVKFINHLKIENVSLYPILVLTACIFIFSATYYLKGNGYLAVYIGGVVIGNAQFVHKRSTRNLFDGYSWIAQLTMFLMLGLLVNPSELKDIFVPGILISLVMIFLTRPISVYLCMIPFRKYTFKAKSFVAWVGLRGAVPIIFAILCYVENVPHSHEIFNIVFLCTLMSLIIQGTSISLMAKWLDVLEETEETIKHENFDIDFPEEIKSVASEATITDAVLERGNCLMDLKLPESSLVIMVKRGDNYFVPTGSTHLHKGDKIMILSDDYEALRETLQNMGFEGAQEQEKTPEPEKILQDQ